MARKKRRGASVAAYFKEVFNQHPEWLALRENKVILDQWLLDHNKTTVPDNIKANLASLKSKLRSEGRGQGGKKGRVKGASKAPYAAVPELEQLEVMIDKCVAVARELSIDHLEPVLRHLRIARAQIVMMFNE